MRNRVTLIHRRSRRSTKVSKLQILTLNNREHGTLYNIFKASNSFSSTNYVPFICPRFNEITASSHSKGGSEANLAWCAENFQSHSLTVLTRRPEGVLRTGSVGM